MKTTLQSIRLSKAACFLILCIILCGNTPSAFGKNISVEPSPSSKHDSILIWKQKTTRSHKISMYPDADQKVVFFHVRGHEGKVYQLYVFDMEGKMVKQTETRNNQTSLIQDIEKGIYLFEVFSDDSRIGNGKMTVL